MIRHEIVQSTIDPFCRSEKVFQPFPPQPTLSLNIIILFDEKLAMKNEYAGWRVPPHPADSEKTSASHHRLHAVNPPPVQTFWDAYVRKRRPCLFRMRGDNDDPQEHEKEIDRICSLLKNYELLVAHAGDRVVEVEVRDTPDGRFGRGRKKKMSVQSFVDEMKRKNPLLYLTTQPLAVDDDGRPELCAAPTLQLLKAGAIPLRLKLLGNLVPQNLNMWIGAGAGCTGMHHDFHDNIYLLLRGKKRFLLASPADAALMGTEGKITRVHPNGRINYEGFATRADGSTEADCAAHSVKVKIAEAEAKLSAAEASGNAGAIRRAEAALERAMDDAIDAHGFDDFEYSGEEEEEGSSRAAKRPKVAEKHPDNFCTKERSDRARLMICEMTAGHALYIPAGWFHEVTSLPCDGAQEAGHCALNYWTHPPDGVSFEAPYRGSIWPHDHETRLAPKFEAE